VKDLYSGNLEAGKYSFVWNSCDFSNRSVSSGIYFIKLDCGYNQVIRKAVLLK